jgi:hypothetical protein
MDEIMDNHSVVEFHVGSSTNGFHQAGAQASRLQYPIKLYFERLKLWYRVTENADAQLGVLVAGRLQGVPQKIALQLRLPRPVAAGGGCDIGDEDLIRLSQAKLIVPATGSIVQEYIHSGLQRLC